MCKDKFEPIENSEYEQDFSDDLESDDSEYVPPQMRYLKILIRFFAIGIVLIFVINITSNIWIHLTPTSIKLMINSVELSKEPKIEEWKNAVVMVRSTHGTGSGFNIKSTGFIVTNYHVIEDSKHNSVSFSSIGRKEITDLFAFPEVDLAFLRIESSENLPTLNLETKAGLRKGDPITIIGNPLNLFNLVGTGKIDKLNHMKGYKSKILSLKAPVYKGSSGSPVINTHGNVIGVVFATSNAISDSEDEIIGLAIPVEEILKRLK